MHRAASSISARRTRLAGPKPAPPHRSDYSYDRSYDHSQARRPRHPPPRRSAPKGKEHRVKPAQRKASSRTRLRGGCRARCSSCRYRSAIDGVRQPVQLAAAMLDGGDHLSMPACTSTSEMARARRRRNPDSGPASTRNPCGPLSGHGGRQDADRQVRSRTHSPRPGSPHSETARVAASRRASRHRRRARIGIAAFAQQLADNLIGRACRRDGAFSSDERRGQCSQSPPAPDLQSRHLLRVQYRAAGRQSKLPERVHRGAERRSDVALGV